MGKVIQPFEITPKERGLGNDIVIHFKGLDYRFSTDEWNPSIVEETAWNLLKDLILGKENSK